MIVKIKKRDLKKLLNKLNDIEDKDYIKKELLGVDLMRKKKRKKKICRSVLYISDSSDDELYSNP